jgi:hypothetical protein
MSDATGDHRTLALSHGQAKWVLWYLFHTVGRPDETFDSTIKFYRRNGLPFDRRELGVGAGTNIVYRYEHIMELAVALCLKNQGVIKTDIVKVLAEERAALRPLYRRAHVERDSGAGAPVEVLIGDKRRRARGLWLDLGISYRNGILTASSPKALGPAKAIESFITRHRFQYLLGLIPLSEIAEEVMRLAPEAPDIRRGRA